MSKIKNSFVVLYGEGGSGKSTSIATLFKLREQRPGMRVIFLSTESNAIPGIQFGLDHHKIKVEPKQFYVAKVEQKTKKKAFVAELAALRQFAKDTIDTTYNVDKKTNANKDKYTFYIDVVSKLTNVVGVDYVTGEEVDLGNIGELTEQDILVVDGLSLIVAGIWSLIQGDRMMNAQNDYQVVQKALKEFTINLTQALDCGLVLLAHAEQDKQGLWRPAINCGQALHGSFGGVFTDIIYAYRTQANAFKWAGKKLGYETIARSLPFQDSLDPDFSKYNLFK